MSATTKANKGIGKKIREYINLMLWVFKVAKKPDRDDYMSIVKIGGLLVVVLGAYSLIFNFIFYLLVTPHFSIPYPENIIVLATIVVIIAALSIVLIISTRNMGKQTRKGSKS
ncbi:MAG: hypothetical protein ACP5NY_00415 [Thermocladium sp.]